MGRRAITEAQYNKLIEAFRQHPDHPTEVARQASCDYRTAIRAWEIGWPKKGWPPISTTIDREKIKARSILQAQEEVRRAAFEKEREDALKNSAQARAQEGQMVGLARTGALQALTVSGQLVTSARELAKLVKRKLDIEAARADDDPKQMTPEHLLHVISKVSSIMSQINSLSHEAMVMERLHLGQPTNVIGVTTLVQDMTIDELEVRLSSARDAIQEVVQFKGSLKGPPVSLDNAKVGKTVVIN